MSEIKITKLFSWTDTRTNFGGKILSKCFSKDLVIITQNRKIVKVSDFHEYSFPSTSLLKIMIYFLHMSIDHSVYNI